MGRVVTDTELVAIAAEDRQAGRRLALANGCFDVLHVGHVRYLEGARREADRLIVAVNDDESVRGLKGRDRPILPSATRAELVAALRAVDYVVVFSDPTVERLLRLVQPDVHCKGTDYTTDTVPERDVVRAYGGRVAIVGDAKDHSTHDLVARIAGESPSRLLVVRLGSLGDLVHALPAVSALRRAHPAMEIDWLVDAVHQEFLELVPDISSIVTLRDRTVRGWLDVRRRLRARQYDIAVDFQGLLKSAALARLSGAKRVIGFDRAALREGVAAPFYTERVDVGEGRHVIEKNLRLVAPLGGTADRMEFPIREVASPALDYLRSLGVDRFAIINCGAAWPNKRWPPDRFGALASWLRDRHGLASVVLWGPGEADLAEAVAAASSGAARPAPETRLTDLVAMARVARLMISGDTGPTHIAAAVGTPIVALFGPTNPHRNGPWDPKDEVVTRYDACECHYERRCRRDGAHWCLATIGDDEVRRAVDRRLAT